jgi:type IV pilus assembly protein PilC
MKGATMQKFKYTAKNTTGSQVSGSVNATSEAEAVNQLQKQSLTVLMVKPEGSSLWSFKLFGGGDPRPHAKSEDMVLFTRQMATMISAGIPLLEALEVQAEQVSDKGFRVAIRRIVDRVRSGSDLSAALADYPKIFKPIFLNMIRAGEASGQLDEILLRLAEYQEASVALRREIKAAMTYPVISLSLITGITLFLMVGILPKFKQIFDNLMSSNPKASLPGLTKFMLSLSLAMRDHFLVGSLALIGLTVAIVLYVRTGPGEWQWDWLKLRIPVFGSLFSKVAMSRFSRTFATLIRSGVPILGALEIVAGTAGNRIVADAVMEAKESVRQGNTLAEPLARSGVFPPMVTRMISIGEKSGAMEGLLVKISEFYDQQVSATVESLTSLIEPLMIGVMGVMVGSIVLSVFLPILKLQQLVSR